jgi:hypothetical protein
MMRFLPSPFLAPACTRPVADWPGQARGSALWTTGEHPPRRITSQPLRQSGDHPQAPGHTIPLRRGMMQAKSRIDGLANPPYVEEELP